MLPWSLAAFRRYTPPARRVLISVVGSVVVSLPPWRVVLPSLRMVVLRLTHCIG